MGLSRDKTQRFTAIILVCVLMSPMTRGEKIYDPGATDDQIKIGTVTSLSGLGNAYAAVGRAEAAYFQMVNDQGGIRGRKIEFISRDSGFEPGKSLALARELVEKDNVLLIFSSLGTEANLAMRSYMNEQKIPQLFVQSASSVFNDPAHFPWTMGLFVSYRQEGLVYAKYIRENKPDGRIGILYADNDAGREYLAGIHEGLGDKASAMIVREIPYETSDETLNSQIAALKNSGADVFLNLSIGTFATRAIRTAYDMDWHPLQFIPNASLSVAAFLEPAGLRKAAGIITNARSKGWLSVTAQDDPDVRDFLQWMKNYNPNASLRDQNNCAGYERAEALVEVLKKCGDDLTRANVMKQAASLDMTIGMLRPGIRITTSATDYQPIKQLFLMRFDGSEWVPFGSVIGE